MKNENYYIEVNLCQYGDEKVGLLHDVGGIDIIIYPDLASAQAEADRLAGLESDDVLGHNQYAQWVYTPIRACMVDLDDCEHIVVIHPDSL